MNAMLQYFQNQKKQKIQKFGKNVTLRMTDGTEIIVTVDYKKEQEDGSVMLIFKTSKYVEELIAYRKISLEVIWWSYSGLKIPNSAIMEENRKKLCNKKQNWI